MRLLVDWVDEAEFLRGRDTRMIERAAVRHEDDGPSGTHVPVAKEGRFWIPQVSLLDPACREASNWALTQSGDLLRIPVVSYLTMEPSAAHVFGLGAQLGMTAAAAVTKLFQETPTAAVLVMSKQVRASDTEGRYRCYLGLALQTD